MTATISGVDSIKLVFYDYFTVLFHELFKLLIEFLPRICFLIRVLQIGNFPFPPHRTHLPFFSTHGITNAFLLGNNLEIFLVILGANLGCPLEHHMFKQMCNPRDPWPLIHTTHTRNPAPGNTWSIMTFQKQHFHSIGKIVLFYGNLLCPQE